MTPESLGVRYGAEGDRPDGWSPLELEWSLMALWGMCLIGEESVQKIGESIERTSPVKVLRAFRRTITDYRVVLEPGEGGLKEVLESALTDDGERFRSKTNPEHPRKSQKERLHEPIIEIASNPTRNQAKALKTRPSIA